MPQETHTQETHTPSMAIEQDTHSKSKAKLRALLDQAMRNRPESSPSPACAQDLLDSLFDSIMHTVPAENKEEEEVSLSGHKRKQPTSSTPTFPKEALPTKQPKQKECFSKRENFNTKISRINQKVKKYKPLEAKNLETCKLLCELQKKKINYGEERGNIGPSKPTCRYEYALAAFETAKKGADNFGLKDAEFVTQFYEIILSLLKAASNKETKETKRAEAVSHVRGCISQFDEAMQAGILEALRPLEEAPPATALPKKEDLTFQGKIKNLEKEMSDLMGLAHSEEWIQACEEKATRMDSENNTYESALDTFIAIKKTVEIFSQGTLAADKCAKMVALLNKVRVPLLEAAPPPCTPAEKNKLEKMWKATYKKLPAEKKRKTMCAADFSISFPLTRQSEGETKLYKTSLNKRYAGTICRLKEQLKKCKPLDEKNLDSCIKACRLHKSIVDIAQKNTSKHRNSYYVYDHAKNAFEAVQKA